MKENMTVSETHESNPWNVVECAMSGKSGFTKIPVYFVFSGARQTAIKIASFNFPNEIWFKASRSPNTPGPATPIMNEKQQLWSHAA
jgi:hypothetical protein